MVLDIIIRIIVCIGVYMLSSPISSQTYKGRWGENIKWEYDVVSHSITMSGRGDMLDARVDSWRNGIASIHDFVHSAEHLIIEEGISSVGAGAFSEFANLQSVHLPSTIKKIGRSAFSGCIKLRAFEIPDSVVTIDDHAFLYCISLKGIKLPANLTSVGTGVFYKCIGIKTIRLPSHLQNISESMFAGCWNLKQAYIPEGISIVAHDAFAESRIREINMPGTITTVINGAFAETPNLNKLTVAADNPFYTSGSRNDYIVDTRTATLIAGCKRTKVPEGVKTIAPSAFEGCRIKNICLPNSVTVVGEKAFYGCGKLKTIILGDNVKEVGLHALKGCNPKLCVKITTRIPPIMYPCVIEETVPVTPHIEPWQLQDLKEIIFQVTVRNDYEHMTLVVPRGTRQLYGQAEGWKDFGRIIEE